jgi:hypothetical protein
MDALVVYESLWGNTAAVARSIAEGIGSNARALTTDEATPERIAQADLLVVGAPVHAFRMPSEKTRQTASGDEKAPKPADLGHPSIQTWLAGLPRRPLLAAAFETAMHWSPGGSTGAIQRALEAAGHRVIAKKHRFFVAGVYGPMKEGELERAREWGAELARTVATRIAA